MICADPWDEVPRLESLVETELGASLERSRLRASAEHFCVERCRVDGRCRLAGALRYRDECPLLAYARLTPLSL